MFSFLSIDPHWFQHIVPAAKVSITTGNPDTAGHSLCCSGHSAAERVLIFRICTKWAPLLVIYKWPYKWVAGVKTPISGVLTLLYPTYIDPFGTTFIDWILQTLYFPLPRMQSWQIKVKSLAPGGDWILGRRVDPIYLYLDPQGDLHCLKVNPSKQGRTSKQNKGHLGSR